MKTPSAEYTVLFVNPNRAMLLCLISSLEPMLGPWAQMGFNEVQLTQSTQIAHTT